MNKVNQVGKYATSDQVDEIQLLKMVFELTERDRMVMWSEGYIDQVIEKLPEFARDILVNRKEKWENTKAFVQDELSNITIQQQFIEKLNSGRKEFAIFVMEHYQSYQSLLFLIYDHNLKEDDIRKFVYRRRFGGRK